MNGLRDKLRLLLVYKPLTAIAVLYFVKIFRWCISDQKYEIKDMKKTECFCNIFFSFPRLNSLPDLRIGRRAVRTMQSLRSSRFVRFVLYNIRSDLAKTVPDFRFYPRGSARFWNVPVCTKCRHLIQYLYVLIEIFCSILPGKKLKYIFAKNSYICMHKKGRQ